MGLELLAPAKNAEQGILALRCGADALYMGGPAFGARASATNELADFEKVTREARLWGAKVFATLNTIIYDHELEAARRQAWDLYHAGVDALILQDMGLLELDLPPMPIHASTQAVCDSPEKVAFLADAGFSRAILARELSLGDMRAIRAASDIELEAFVFGALCVSDSGHCYLSGDICDRSGNRGTCAQPCRAPWNLLDASGKVLVRDKHLLSVQDMDLSDHLEAMADAGIMSFKIEGRLKDADYVKNVVSHLRLKLDSLLERRPEFHAASLGHTSRAFEPDPTKTFQRGLSTYRIEGERQSMGTPHTGRHLGEVLGKVRSVQGDRVLLETDLDLHPGDGLAWVDGQEATGTVVNAVEPAGKPRSGLIGGGPTAWQVFVQDASRLKTGTQLHRNVDHQWLKAMRSAKVERRIPLMGRLSFEGSSAVLELVDPEGMRVEVRQEGTFDAPRDVAAAGKTLEEALGRMGGTPFQLARLEVPEVRFVPVSLLNALRREGTEALEALRREPREREGRRPRKETLVAPVKTLDLTWNVANAKARAFYEKAGATVLEPAAELQKDLTDRVVMTTRHCLKFELGWCHVHPNPDPWRHLPEPKGPIFMENGTTRLECQFDCRNCRMLLVLR